MCVCVCVCERERDRERDRDRLRERWQCGVLATGAFKCKYRADNNS